MIHMTSMLPFYNGKVTTFSIILYQRQSDAIKDNFSKTICSVVNVIVIFNSLVAFLNCILTSICVNTDEASCQGW